jgi:hypothetical protein
MDNIECFDRDKPLPDGSLLEQSDGTSWTALVAALLFEYGGRLLGATPLRAAPAAARRTVASVRGHRARPAR